MIHLQGFIFFGTASRIVDEVRREAAAAGGRLRHLILDFANVQGLDGSALASFERLGHLTALQGTALAFAAMPPLVAGRLADLPRVPGAVVYTAPTLDDALSWREAEVLAGSSLADPPSLAAALTEEFENKEYASIFFGLLERAEFPLGSSMTLQGELSDDLLFIERGRASVAVTFKQGMPPRRVRTLAVGTMVGEIGFCLGLPRTATVIAEEPCRVLRLTRAAMQRLEAEHPAVALAFQRVVLRRVSKRLLNKDQLISALVLERAD